jgi:hypothetical protein
MEPSLVHERQPLPSNVHGSIGFDGCVPWLITGWLDQRVLDAEVNWVRSGLSLA